MAFIEEEIVNRLKSDSNVFGYVADNIHPADQTPQEGKTSWITYQLINGGYGYTHGGHDGLNDRIYQINVYGSSYSDAKDIMFHVVNSLNGFQGTWGSFTIHAVFIDDERDDYEEKAEIASTQIDARIVYSC